MVSNHLKYLENARSSVAEKVRSLRIQRRWGQKELAEKIGFSQARLSEVERGAGSFTAEQLLLIAQLFNVPVSQFAPRTRARVVEHADLQNALVRLGAPQLQERDDILPSERLDEVARVVTEALVTGAPRLIVALAPVLVQQIDRVSLPRLSRELRALGLERRLPWLAENVLEAIRRQHGADVPRELASRFRRAETVLELWLEGERRRLDGAEAVGEDLLDATIRSARTAAQVRAEASAISRRWGVVTALAPADFTAALEAARAGS